jgi:hypothetical protein
LLEAAVVRLDVIDVQMRRLRGRLSWRRHGVKGNFGLARKGGQRLAAIADEVICGGHNPRQHGGDRGAVVLRQNDVEVAPFRSRRTERAVSLGAGADAKCPRAAVPDQLTRSPPRGEGRK